MACLINSYLTISMKIRRMEPMFRKDIAVDLYQQALLHAPFFKAVQR